VCDLNLKTLYIQLNSICTTCTVNTSKMCICRTASVSFSLPSDTQFQKQICPVVDFPYT
jgi:hypothetical protein